MADFILLHLRKDARPWVVNRDLITDIGYEKVTHPSADPKEPVKELIQATICYGGYEIAVLETPEQVIMRHPFIMQLKNQIEKALKEAQEGQAKKEPSSVKGEMKVHGSETHRMEGGKAVQQIEKEPDPKEHTEPPTTLKASPAPAAKAPPVLPGG